MDSKPLIDQIRDDIITGNFSAGDRLIERELCKKYKSTRSVVRQVLRQLNQEGFVSIEPFRGAYVAKLEQKDISQIYDILGALEGLSIRAAISTIDDTNIAKIEALILNIETCPQQADKLYKANMELHQYLASLSNNARLISFCKNLRLQAYRMSLENFYITEQVVASLKEHRTILECIRRRNGIEVENLIREHYQESKDRLIKAINKTL
jgi:DNA-binding GntR family transcriptional regulator